MVRLTWMQITGSTYNLRTSSIHLVSMGRFSTDLKKVSDLPSDDLCKDSMRVLQGMVKTCMPITTKQTLKYELGVSRI